MSDLTVAELKALISTNLSDEALQMLIDAAEAQILDVAGPDGSRVEEHLGGGQFIMLNRYAASITTIREADAGVDLLTTEYELRADARSIERRVPGSDVYDHWSGPVRVTYVPRDYAALKQIATVQLIKGTLANNPGVLGMTEGNWSIQFRNGETWTGNTEDALAALGLPWSFG